VEGIDLVGPQLAVLVGAGVVLLWDALLPQQRRLLPFLALVALAVSAAWTLSWVARDDYRTGWGGSISLDEYAVFFYFLFVGVTATVVIASIDWVNRAGRGQGEYYALILTTCAGLMFLACARDLITIYIALELSSIPQYILAGWAKDSKSSEAGMKYLLMGAVASSLLLYGMALLYGLTGTTYLSEIGDYIASEGRRTERPRAGDSAADCRIRLQDGGGAVPDVGAGRVPGAPTPVAAFLSVGSKAAAFAVVIRIFFEALGEEFHRMTGR
jgi:NADH-quinone oxidoreductase subunit N